LEGKDGLSKKAGLVNTSEDINLSFYFIFFRKNCTQVLKDECGKSWGHSKKNGSRMGWWVLQKKPRNEGRKFQFAFLFVAFSFVKYKRKKKGKGQIKRPKFTFSR
jgi:hypothetical protein